MYAGVVKLTIQYNDDKNTWEDEEAAKAADNSRSGADTKDTEDGKVKHEPTIFRRLMDEDNPKKVRYEEIDITSPGLKRLYSSIAAHSQQSDESSSDSSMLTIVSPFVYFIWYWDRFEAACESSENDTEEQATARADLKQLMALIRKSQVEPYFRVRDVYLTKGTIPFEYLWTLFPPGTKVCAKTIMDDVQMLEVRFPITPPLGEIKLRSKEFRVLCTGFDWDGVKFGAFEYELVVEKSIERNEMQIDTLAVCPMQYHRNKYILQRDLLERGQRFWSLCKPGKFQRNYNGALVTSKPNESSRARMLSRQANDDDDTVSSFSGMEESGGTFTSQKEYSGQVIVDAYSFLRAQDDYFTTDEPPLGEYRGDSCPEHECTW